MLSFSMTALMTIWEDVYESSTFVELAIFSLESFTLLQLDTEVATTEVGSGFRELFTTSYENTHIRRSSLYTGSICKTSYQKRWMSSSSGYLV